MKKLILVGCLVFVLVGMAAPVYAASTQSTPQYVDPIWPIDPIWP